MLDDGQMEGKVVQKSMVIRWKSMVVRDLGIERAHAISMCEDC